MIGKLFRTIHDLSIHDIPILAKIVKWTTQEPLSIHNMKNCATKPVISFYPNSQKNENYFLNSLTNEILRDICYKVTRRYDYEIKLLTGDYNKGRLLFIEYMGRFTYVSLSEMENNGRNSSLQSVPTAINMFYADSEHANKQLVYYFLPHTGNLFTPYHKFIYRLMATIGIQFLNYSSKIPRKFTSIYDLINYRDKNKRRNSANNSTYVTIAQDGRLQILAKTFGANKYESTLIIIACAKIFHKPIQIFNVQEGGLNQLPKSSQKTFACFGNLEFDNSLNTLPKRDFSKDGFSLRAPLYLYNLLNKLGPKTCACCGCPIPQIVQAAHIWNIADIKREATLSDEQKYAHATSEDNGIWLCNNHHKLFDSHILRLDVQGRFSLFGLESQDCLSFAESITSRKTISKQYLTPGTISYIQRRCELLASSDKS